MELQRPFAVVTPTVDGDVLSALARADAAFTPPQVHRLIGRRSEAGVRKALERLSEQGVVRAERAGQAMQYQLNRDHLAAEAIVALANLRQTFISRLRGLLSGWTMPTPYAALFGSAARGTMTTSSDIDIFVLRAGDVEDDERWQEQIFQLELTVHRWTGNDTQVLEYDETDMAVPHDGDLVITEVLRDGISLAGSPTYLRQMLGIH
jgi:predicted nucleotidyltransferase